MAPLPGGILLAGIGGSAYSLESSEGGASSLALAEAQPLAASRDPQKPCMLPRPGIQAARAAASQQSQLMNPLARGAEANARTPCLEQGRDMAECGGGLAQGRGS